MLGLSPAAEGERGLNEWRWRATGSHGDKFAEQLSEVALILFRRALTWHQLIIRINVSMDYADTLPPQRPFGQTTRPDAWWVQPLFVFLGFSAFIVYSTWAAFQGVSDMHNHACTYWYGGCMARTAGPIIFRRFTRRNFGAYSPHAIFGTLPAWWPGWAPFSPAFLILWAPAGFRFTCYYYRGAYYKSFWADPINCAVGEPRKTYLGERYFPLIIQNVHRYMFYLAACSS